jgi:histidine triad (HIT) family protein
VRPSQLSIETVHSLLRTSSSAARIMTRKTEVRLLLGLQIFNERGIMSNAELGWRGQDALIWAQVVKKAEHKHAMFFAQKIDAYKSWKISSEYLAKAIDLYERDKERIECIFCQIIRGESPAEVLMDDFNAWVIRPLNPVVEGHVIVIPLEHQKDFTPFNTGYSFAHFAFETAGTYAAQFPDQDFNLITSKGKNATQSVFHLHVHLVPRHKGDGLKLPWSGQNFH